jgi:NRPS condensation-like uncharacterized protein
VNIPKKIPTVLIDRIALVMNRSGTAVYVVQMELEFPSELDPDRLALALDLVLDAEPVLGCRMVIDSKRPYWQRLLLKERQNFRFTRDEREYLEFRNSGQDSLKGPQLQACLLRGGKGDRLLLKVCHEAGDAGGVKDVASRLSAIYNRLEKEPGYRPEPNLSGCRGLDQVMRQLPKRAYPKIVWNFLRQSFANRMWERVVNLSLPMGPLEPMTYVVKQIPAECVQKIAAFGKKHDATINDVLVAAHFQAQAKETGWDRKTKLMMITTVDLRRWYLPDEKAGGICNLSLFEYPNLGCNLGKDFEDTVGLVSRMTRSRKNDWFGLSDLSMVTLFKLLPFPVLNNFGARLAFFLSTRHAFPNAFTNMGEIKIPSVNFGIQPASAHLLPPLILPPYFASGLSGYDGSLTLSAGAPVHAQKTIDRFYESVLEFLPG